MDQQLWASGIITKVAAHLIPPTAMALVLLSCLALLVSCLLLLSVFLLLLLLLLLFLILLFTFRCLICFPEFTASLQPSNYQKKKASNVDTASHKLHTHRPWLLQPLGISKGPRRIVTTVAFWGTMLTHGALWLIRGSPWGEVGMTIQPWDLGLISGFQNLGRPHRPLLG